MKRRRWAPAGFTPCESSPTRSARVGDALRTNVPERAEACKASARVAVRRKPPGAIFGSLDIPNPAQAESHCDTFITETDDHGLESLRATSKADRKPSTGGGRVEAQGSRGGDREDQGRHRGLRSHSVRLGAAREG